VAGPSYESSVNYHYDAGDRLTSVVDSISGTITPGFDGMDRLTSETTPQGSVSYQYDAAGREASMTVAGQPAVNYTYDNANRLTQIAQGTSNVAFAYDAASRRTSLTLPNGVSVTYGYDSTSHLTSVSYQSGANLLGNLAYTYDQSGRLVQTGGSYARTGLPSAITSATYDAANRLTNWAGNSYSYDPNGNLTSDGINTYVWDARNQLSSISGAASASFLYDPSGKRASKTVGGLTTGFLYDGANIVQELSGSTPTANLLTGGVDETFTRTGASMENFLTDVLGSPVATTDTTGAIVTQYTYEPFGNTSSTGAISSNPFQYTGRENDGTGLYYYRARYYSPRTQRFISQDPIGFAGGINLYAYVGDSPVDLIDPFGLRPGDKYPSGRCAGWHAIRDYNTPSKRRNLEYDGWVYGNPDGTYSYTDPSANGGQGIGDPAQGRLLSTIPLPADAYRAGWYHTHSAYDRNLNGEGNPQPGTPGYNWHDDGNEIFSDADKSISDAYQNPGYLGTPQGTTEEYVPNLFHPGGGTEGVMNGRNCGCH
jgi:RHS repeat-associated protein